MPVGRKVDLGDLLRRDVVSGLLKTPLESFLPGLERDRRQLVALSDEVELRAWLEELQRGWVAAGEDEGERPVAPPSACRASVPSSASRMRSSTTSATLDLPMRRS